MLDLPILVFAVSYNCSLKDSGHMDLRPGSDTNITFYSSQVVFNYVKTSIQGFLQISSNFCCLQAFTNLGY